MRNCINVLSTVTNNLVIETESRSPDGTYGIINEQGNWTGIIGALARDEVDLSIADLAITTPRTLVEKAVIKN